MVAESRDQHLIPAKTNQECDMEMSITRWILLTSALLPAKWKRVSEGTATLYLECELKLPLYLKHLGKSLCFGNRVNYRLGQRNPEEFLSFPLSPSAFRKAEAGNCYGFIRQREAWGLRLAAKSPSSKWILLAKTLTPNSKCLGPCEVCTEWR